MKSRTILVAAAVLALAAGSGAWAAAPQGWKFEITPGLWMAGLEGDMTLAGQEIDFDRSAGEVLEHMEAGGSVSAKIQCNRLVLGGQVDFFRLGTDDLEVVGHASGARLDTDLLFSEAALGYVWDGWKEGQSFTVGIGARQAHLDSDLELQGGESAGGDQDLADPMLVVWPVMPLFPSKVKGLTLAPAFSIGGGGDSRLVYELFPQLRYQVAEHVVARFGYRTVGYQVAEDRNGNELDFNLAGFLIGLGATF